MWEVHNTLYCCTQRIHIIVILLFPIKKEILHIMENAHSKMLKKNTLYNEYNIKYNEENPECNV